MDKEQAFKHLKNTYVAWPNVNDPMPSSHRGWRWVKRYDSGEASMIFQSIDDQITLDDYMVWLSNTVKRGEMLNWAKLNLKIWPTVSPDMTREVLPGWMWRQDHTPEGNRPSFVLEGLIGERGFKGMATITEADWTNYHIPAPSPNYNPDYALKWCVDNIIVWPTLDGATPASPDCWVWSDSLSRTHKSLALLNDCGAVMAVIAKTDWDKARAIIETVNPIMKFFEYKHLPETLKQVSEPMCLMAKAYDTILPDGPEKSAGLRKLLEAKDCFVRAKL